MDIDYKVSIAFERSHRVYNIRISTHPCNGNILRYPLEALYEETSTNDLGEDCGAEGNRQLKGVVRTFREIADGIGVVLNLWRECIRSPVNIQWAMRARHEGWRAVTYPQWKQWHQCTGRQTAPRHGNPINGTTKNGIERVRKGS
jgi:hypothetical protein